MVKRGKILSWCSGTMYFMVFTGGILTEEDMALGRGCPGKSAQCSSQTVMLCAVHPVFIKFIQSPPVQAKKC